MYRKNDDGNERGCMNILVGMSGGVDSSVAAALLKSQGHNVFGATMKIWNKKNKHTPKTRCSHGACYGPDEEEDVECARKICKQLDIPYYVFDCADEYEKIVLENFKEEYLNGRTPNPCIRCNSMIKFDVLPFVARKSGLEFEKFATGHYARIEKDKNTYLLKCATDKAKDQSYFLYRLRQNQLKNILLPLGEYKKEQIREIAAKFQLETAQKPDSQDFYEGDYNELLQISDLEGNIVDKKGNILGKHKGIWNYTIGQRKGLKISASEPLYVIELKKETNEVVVGFKNDVFKNRLIACDMNWINKINKNKIRCSAKFRSSQEKQEVIVSIKDDLIEAEFITPQKAISPGQSIVLYQDDVVLGGGIIDKIL